MADQKGFEAVKDGVRGRIETRFLPGEAKPEDGVIDEFAHTIYDRLLLQTESEELPELGLSIVVDATMKALRLRGYEGSTSESDSDGGSISNSFIDDVLSAYAKDIDFLRLRSQGSGSAGVKFL